MSACLSGSVNEDKGEKLNLRFLIFGLRAHVSHIVQIFWCVSEGMPKFIKCRV